MEGTTRRIRAFNKSDRPIFWTLVGNTPEDTEQTDLKPGRWVEVSEELATTYLWKSRDVIVDWGRRPESSRGYLPLPHLMLSSPIECLTGYGNTATYLIPYLAKHFHLHLYPLNFWAPGEWKQEVLSPVTMDLMDAASMVYCDWSIALTIPTEVSKVPGRNIMLYSMWETNKLPHGWADAVNEYAKCVAVPCADQKKVWQDSGVKLPVFVVPLGVDTDLWKYKQRPPRDDKHPFTIVTFGLLSSRKSPIETFTKVCWAALDDREDWRLILKTWGGQYGGGKFPTVIQDSRCEQINAHYRPQEMVDLCHRADCGIFLSRYEGFGLPPREMMSTGLPVIWSAAHGHIEDCFNGVTIDIPVSDEIEAKQAYAGLGGWVEPDWEAAARALRQEYEDWHARGKKQSVMGTAAAEYIRENRTWAHTAQALSDVIHEVAQ